MGAAASTGGLGARSSDQPDEIELMSSDEGVKLHHMRTLRDTYFAEDVSPKFRLSPDGGHIVDSELVEEPDRQGLSPKTRRAQSRGLPELLSNSPRNSLVRALSSSLSKDGSWQLVPDSGETSKPRRQLSQAISADRPSVPRPTASQRLSRAASRAESDAFAAVAAFNGIDVQPPNSRPDTPEPEAQQPASKTVASASPFAFALAAEEPEDEASEVHIPAHTSTPPHSSTDSDHPSDAPQALPENTAAVKLSRPPSTDTDSTEMPAPSTPPRGSPSPAPRPFPSNPDTPPPVLQVCTCRAGRRTAIDTMIPPGRDCVGACMHHACSTVEAAAPGCSCAASAWTSLRLSVKASRPDKDT